MYWSWLRKDPVAHTIIKLTTRKIAESCEIANNHVEAKAIDIDVNCLRHPPLPLSFTRNFLQGRGEMLPRSRHLLFSL